MKREWNGREGVRGNEVERDLREDRPLNTSEGREVRELKPRKTEEREMKR